MIKVLNPLNSKVGQKVEGKLIFLAGPIVEAADWQEEIIDYFNMLSNKYQLDFTIATPRINTNNRLDRLEQVRWEEYYLSLASKQGIILFWLAEQVQREETSRSFARTTRFELGEWLMKSMIYNKFKNISIGIDELFDGKEYIKIRLNDMNYPHIVVDTIKQLAIDTFKRLKEMK